MVLRMLNRVEEELIMAYQAVTLFLGISKPKSQRPSLPNISAMLPAFLSSPRLFIKGFLLSSWYSILSL